MHDELLQLSSELLQLAGTKTGAEQEVTLRRSVSTAYYALFHLLTYETSARLVAGTGEPAVTPRRRREVARAFSHAQVRMLCLAFSGWPGPSPTGPVQRTLAMVGTVAVPEDLGIVAWSFVELHGRREWADYDFTTAMPLGAATTYQQLAVEAFARWVVASATPEARLLLGLLPVYGSLERR